MEIFAHFGVIKDASLDLRPNRSWISNGNAYITYEKPEEVEECIKKMNGGEEWFQIIRVTVFKSILTPLGQIDGQEISVREVLARRSPIRRGRSPPRRRPGRGYSPPRGPRGMRGRSPPRRGRSPPRRRRYQRSCFSFLTPDYSSVLIIQVPTPTSIKISKAISVSSTKVFFTKTLATTSPTLLKVMLNHFIIDICKSDRS